MLVAGSADGAVAEAYPTRNLPVQAAGEVHPLSIMSVAVERSRYASASMMALSVGLGRIAFSVFTGSGW